MTWALIVVAAAAVLYVAWRFNRLVALSQRAGGAWSDIDVQLKRRCDLVPSLVATVAGYARHERGTLTGVTAARQQAVAVAGQPPAQRGGAESALASAVRGLFAVAEAYPQLKADASFRALHVSLVEIEDTLQYARRYYNAVVRDYNTMAHSFPANVVAGVFGFRDKEFFQIDAADRAVPPVDLEPPPAVQSPGNPGF